MTFINSLDTLIVNCGGCSQMLKNVRLLLDRLVNVVEVLQVILHKNFIDDFNIEIGKDHQKINELEFIHKRSVKLLSSPRH